MNPLVPATLISLAVALLASAVAYRYWSSHRLHQRCVRLCHRIAHELSQRQEPHLVAERVFDTVIEHTGAAIGVLSFRSGTDNTLEVVRVHGLPDHLLKPGTRLPAGSSGWETGSVRVSGQLEIISRGLRKALRETAGVPLDRRQSMICIPLAGPGETRGLLQLVSGPGHTFRQEHLHELEGVGYYLNAAINNARVIEALRHQRDASRALYDIGLTISRFLDLDEILQQAVSKVRTLLDAQVTWYLDCTRYETPRAVIRQLDGKQLPAFPVGSEVRLTGQVGGFFEPAAKPREIRHVLFQDSGQEHTGTDLFCDTEFDSALRALGMTCGMAVPVGNGSGLKGVLCCFSDRPHQYLEDDVELLHRVAAQLLIALNTADLHNKLKMLAIIGERQRLSDELHDNMAQVINGVSLELHYLEKMAARKLSDNTLTVVTDRLSHIRDQLVDTKATIRHAIFELRLAEDRDLWGNLLEFAQRFEHWHDLQVDTELPEEPVQLPIGDQREVLHITQEALWNIRKHSGANKARISGDYDTTSGNVQVVISDTGNGLTPDAQDSGQGIATMQDRARRLGGHLQIASNSDHGVDVVLQFANGN
jgi:GAF domain-containing protein